MKTADGKVSTLPHVTNNRRPIGTPGAGEWTNTVHGDPNVTLGLNPTQAENQARMAGYDEKRARMDALLSRYTSPEELNRQVLDASDYFVRKYNQSNKSNHIDTQDIAQETVLAVYGALEKGVHINDFPRFVGSLAANVTVRATENKFRAENRRAYRAWAEKCEEMQIATGRSVTRREEDALAQEVLDEWEKPRHKPSADFRTPHTVDTSIDAATEDGFSIASTLAEDHLVDGYIEPDSFMDKAFNAVEMTGSAHKAEAKRLMFNAFAERAEDVPLAIEGSLSQRQVTKHRAAMKDEQGNSKVLEACRDWGDEKDSEAVAALFAPFGKLDVNGEHNVVNFIESQGDLAEAMWASAVAFANNKHAKVS